MSRFYVLHALENDKRKRFEMRDKKDRKKLNSTEKLEKKERNSEINKFPSSFVLGAALFFLLDT